MSGHNDFLISFYLHKTDESFSFQGMQHIPRIGEHVMYEGLEYLVYKIVYYSPRPFMQNVSVLVKKAKK